MTAKLGEKLANLEYDMDLDLDLEAERAAFRLAAGAGLRDLLLPRSIFCNKVLVCNWLSADSVDESNICLSV